MGTEREEEHTYNNNGNIVFPPPQTHINCHVHDTNNNPEIVLRSTLWMFLLAWLVENSNNNKLVD